MPKASPSARRSPTRDAPARTLVVQPGGARSWAFRFGTPAAASPPRKLSPATLSLAAARLEVAKARLELQQGIDPAPVLQRAPVLSVSQGDDTSIEVALAQFIELHVSRKVRASTARQYVGVINRIVLPAWRGRRLDSIRRRDVIALVEHIAIDRSVMANRVLAVLSKFFRWACARDLIEISPATGVERPHSEEARQRKLTDDELRRLWIACEGDPFGPAVRLLILTAARENEVGALPWSEIDGAEWKLPAERAKNNRAHTIPLSEQAQAILKSVPRFAGCDFVFTLNGRGPISSWGRAKQRLSAKAGIPAKDWRIHDLRRTAASGMQTLRRLCCNGRASAQSHDRDVSGYRRGVPDRSSCRTTYSAHCSVGAITSRI